MACGRTISATAMARRCIAPGGDTRLVKEVLGHSDTRMTERYTLGHVPEAMRAATARFEEHLAEAPLGHAARTRHPSAPR